MPDSSNLHKPTLLPVNFNAIPAALRQCHRWLLWRYRQAPDGTWKKAFYTARGNRTGPVIVDFTASFDAVQATYEYYLLRAPYDGIAFALGDIFAAIELQGVFGRS